MKKGLCITLALIFTLCACSPKPPQNDNTLLAEQDEMRQIVSCAYFSYMWNQSETAPAHGTITLQTDAEKAAYVVFYATHNTFVDGSKVFSKEESAEILKKTLGLAFSEAFAAEEEWLSPAFYARDYDAVAYLDYVETDGEWLWAQGILCGSGNLGLYSPRDFTATFRYIDGTLQLHSLTVGQTADEAAEEL